MFRYLRPSLTWRVLKQSWWKMKKLRTESHWSRFWLITEVRIMIMFWQNNSHSCSGLSVDQFGLIVEQLTRLQCSAPLARKLIHLLVPAQPVPASILVDLSLWGLSHPSVDCVCVPVLRLVSLCLQYECVEDKQELTGLYELYLSLITKDKLTNHVAELLQLLTSRYLLSAPVNFNFLQLIDF